MRSGSRFLLVVTLSISCMGCASTWRPVPHDQIETTLTETQVDSLWLRRKPARPAAVIAAGAFGAGLMALLVLAAAHGTNIR